MVADGDQPLPERSYVYYNMRSTLFLDNYEAHCAIRVASSRVQTCFSQTWVPPSLML
jgi:hypothetical protein